MRHRIGALNLTGLGNPNTQLMDCKATRDKIKNRVINRCAKEAYKIFFKGTKLDFEYCDAQANFDMSEIKIGIEPAYMYEDLKIIIIRKKKEHSEFITGRAWGVYGSDIASKNKYYSEYKNKSKFVNFIDEWHKKLF